MNIIKKVMKTESAHIVRMASSERCKYNLHGHSGKWIIQLEGKIQENGMVKDFKDLKPIKQFVDLFDHATILWDKEEYKFKDFFMNNFKRVLIMKKNTTAENMARLLFKFTHEYYKNNNNINVYKAEYWETETGCAIATEYDIDDILVYTHKDQS
jgi:6-pyruvoyltetrahydropterin/6-carboxytetrahydropterin synthase